MSEKLAMLTARTCNLEGVGGGGEITPDMVAASLSGLERGVYLYALYKFCGDQNAKMELLERHYVDSVNMALKGGWRLSKSEDMETVGRLSDLAVDESVKPSICGACNGAGIFNNKGECKACQGTGHGKDIAIRKIERRLKVTKHRAEFFWREKLRFLMSRHLEWEQDIHRALKKLTSDKTGV